MQINALMTKRKMQKRIKAMKFIKKKDTQNRSLVELIHLTDQVENAGHNNLPGHPSPRYTREKPNPVTQRLQLDPDSRSRIQMNRPIEN
jgi:hypothetical protein